MSCMMSPDLSTVQIQASPSSALVDEKVNIRLLGLQPTQSITLAALLEEDGKIFVSYAHYKADDNGEVDLRFDESLNGTYTAVEPMGLFWSMVQADGQRPGLRLMKKDVTKPFKVNVSVIPNHITVSTKEHVFKDSMAQVELHRYYMAENVRKLNVKTLDKNTRARGTLFLPPGPGPFPGVIDMFGTAGGLTEFRAALLASRGFASLALAFFGYDDLPEFQNLELDYFVEAADWLYNHPQVMKTGIGAIGVSLGAELAIHMAILNRKVRAVIPINTFYYSPPPAHKLGGVKQPTAEIDLAYLKITEEGLDCGDCYFLSEVPEGAELRIEEAKQAQFLILSGGDDRNADPRHVNKLINRLDKNGLSNYRSIEYPKAGHLLEPPYTPLARSAFHKVVGSVLLFGGECKPHADAQEHSWQEIQSFLRKQLVPKVSIASSKL